MTVTGWLQESERATQPTPADLPAGQVTALDPTALNPGTAVYPAYLVAMSSTPPDSGVRLCRCPNSGWGRTWPMPGSGSRSPSCSRSAG